MVNYMEKQDFDRVILYFSIGYTWNDTVNVLENCNNVFENSLKSAWFFFLESCIHYDSISSVIIQDEAQCSGLHQV